MPDTAPEDVLDDTLHPYIDDDEPTGGGSGSTAPPLPVVFSPATSCVTSLATCWLLQTADASRSLGFTNHTRDLEIDSLVYQAETGITPTTVKSTSGLSVDNMDIQALLSSEAITETELMAGTWDYARITVFLVNYLNLADGKLVVHRGRIGEVTIENGVFMAEARSLLQNASQQIAVLTSATCRARVLGDAECKVNLTPFTVTGTITSVVSGRNLIASGTSGKPAGWFDGGLLRFTSGANVGRSMEIKSFQSNHLVLQQPMPFAVTVGDAVSIVAGCDRRRDTCKTKFSNIVNFRGEPDIPGSDSLIKQATSSDAG